MAIFTLSSCGTTLEDEGFKYIRNQMMSPSSVSLLKCIDAEKTAGMLKQVGWTLEPYQKAVYYDIEAANALGGLLTKSYIVFFVDDVPMDYIETQRVSAGTVNQAKAALRANGFYKDKN